MGAKAKKHYQKALSTERKGKRTIKLNFYEKILICSFGIYCQLLAILHCIQRNLQRRSAIWSTYNLAQRDGF
jgi:hypothetical protein